MPSARRARSTPSNIPMGILLSADRLPGPVRHLAAAVSLALPDRTGRSGSVPAILTATRVFGLRAAGRHDEARRCATAGVAVGGAGRGIRVRLALARYLAHTGAAGDAFAALRDGQPPQRSSARLRWSRSYALIAARAGRYDEARSAIEEVLRARPGDARMLESRARLDHLAGKVFAGPGPASQRPALTIDPIPGRILHLVERSVLEREMGGTLRTRQVVMGQRSVGLDPHVLVLSAGPADEADATITMADGIPHYRLPAGAAYDGAAWPVPDATRDALVEIVQRIRPALVHAPSPYRMGRVGIDLARHFGLPAVYEVRGFREESWSARAGDDGADAARYRMTRAADTACMRAADAVVTLGEGMGAEIASRGVSADRITIVPNAVDADRFRPGERDPELAARLGIAPDEVVVGSVSSFAAYEGFQTLVEALAMLRGRGVRVRGLLVGDGKQRAEVERQVHALGLDEVVIMPGRVKHAVVPSYQRLLDVFVVARMPTRVAQLVTPLKPFEAMASARALVVSDLPALREIIRHGTTGLTFRAGDAEDLAATLERLAADPGLRQSLGAAAREWVLAERTIERNGERYRALYEQLGAA